MSTTCAAAGCAVRCAPARSSAAVAPSTPRSCCSCRASATRPCSRSSASTSWPTCPVWAQTCRTTSRSTCSTRPSCRCPSHPGMRWRHRPRIGAEWLFLRRGPGATNHFEGGGFVRTNDDVTYPNLMFHFLPIAIRYDGSPPAGQSKADHGYQVHIGPMYSDARGSVTIRSTDPKQHPSLVFNYLSTDQDRREWVECVQVARDDPRAAGVRAVRRRRAVTRARRRDRPAGARLGGQGRRDRLPPLVHGQDGRRRPGRARPAPRWESTGH